MGFFIRSKKKQSPSPQAVGPTQREPDTYQATPTLPPRPPHSYGPQQQDPQHTTGFDANSVAYSPPPPSWNHGGFHPSHHGHDQRGYPPIVVNQNYYLGRPPPPQGHPQPHGPYLNNNASRTASKMKLSSAVDVANQMLPCNVVNHFIDDGLPRWHSYGTQVLNSGAALYDQISSAFNDVMTLIDREKYHGSETDAVLYGSKPPSLPAPMPISSGPESSPPPSGSVEMVSKGTVSGPPKKSKKKHSSPPKEQATASNTTLAIAKGTYFAKVEMYANSTLPLDLPRMRVYLPTYPMLCLAAQYSQRVYAKPTGAERDAHVSADWKTGAKAMCIKSVPMDDVDTIVFAIRGSASFMDWAVNLNAAPASPKGFLDDANNLCHAGFLMVAKRMVAPVAARLRQLLEENPRRASYSLLITGHSAGGAVASLLYSHMLAQSKAAASELNHLTDYFRRVHCITFGAPPLSVRPLQKPEGREDARKSIFMSFINEGDPVARADVDYVKSLLDLFATPVPQPKQSSSKDKSKKHSTSKKTSDSSMKKSKSKSSSKKTSSNALAVKDSKISLKPGSSKPVWKVPPSSLSNAGRIVVLRSGKLLHDPNQVRRGNKTVEERIQEGVVAQYATDEQLRGVIWGDPFCHVMDLYARRIEVLAIGAVTAHSG